jgi:retinol dehydrogenase 14
MKALQDMHDKVVLITGASSGLGVATALLLAERGAEVVMVCRDGVRGNFMRKGVAEHATGRAPAIFFADLTLQEQIHILADQIRRSYSHIDVLINNAGAVFAAREFTEDGVEKTLALNYLAPFLLTRLLLDLVLAAPAGRVVNVASQSHSNSLDFANLQGERHYNFFAAYNRSKLCNILFTYELARRLSGTSVTSNCLSPGPTLTRIGDNMRGWPALFPRLLKQIPLLSEHPKRGAHTHVYVASSPDLDGISGRFFFRCHEARTKPITYDAAIAAKLWEISEGLCARSICSESVA